TEGVTQPIVFQLVALCCVRSLAPLLRPCSGVDIDQFFVRRFELVNDGCMPKPIRIKSRLLWDRVQLDAALQHYPMGKGSKILGAGSRPDGRSSAREREVSYIYEDVDHHGNVRIHFWRGKGHRKVRLREKAGSPEFHREYQAVGLSLRRCGDSVCFMRVFLQCRQRGRQANSAANGSRLPNNATA